MKQLIESEDDFYTDVRTIKIVRQRNVMCP